MLWCNPRDRLLLPDHTDSFVDLQNLLVTLVCINLYGNFQTVKVIAITSVDTDCSALPVPLNPSQSTSRFDRCGEYVSAKN